MRCSIYHLILSCDIFSSSSNNQNYEKIKRIVQEHPGVVMISPPPIQFHSKSEKCEKTMGSYPCFFFEK